VTTRTGRSFLACPLTKREGAQFTGPLPIIFFRSSNGQEPPPYGNGLYCFGPITGPSPMTKYPGGAVPFCSQYARAAAACAATLATEGFD